MRWGSTSISPSRKPVARKASSRSTRRGPRAASPAGSPSATSISSRLSAHRRRRGVLRATSRSTCVSVGNEGFPIDGTATFAGPTASAYGYEATDVKARISLDGRRIGLDASANAYGTRATTRGTIRRAGQGQRELTVDLDGRFSRLDLRRLPARLRVPTLETDLAGTYSVDGSDRRPERRRPRSPPRQSKAPR